MTKKINGPDFNSMNIETNNGAWRIYLDMGMEQFSVGPASHPILTLNWSLPSLIKQGCLSPNPYPGLSPPTPTLSYLAPLPAGPQELSCYLTWWKFVLNLISFLLVVVWTKCTDWVYGLSLWTETIDWVYGLSLW